MSKTHGVRRRADGRLLLGVALAVSLAGAGCKDKVVEPPRRTAPKAPDQVDENELVESNAEAFGLPLPEGFQVIHNSPTDITAIGNLPEDRVAQFVRDRVEADVHVGPSKTSFLRVHIKAPRRIVTGALSIEVAKRGGTTAIQATLLPAGPPRPSGAPPPWMAGSDDDDDRPPPQPVPTLKP